MWKSNCACGAKKATLFFTHDVVCKACLHRFLCLFFFNMFMFNSLVNNIHVKAETDEIKKNTALHFLFCSSDMFANRYEQKLWIQIRLPLKENGY